MASRSEGNRDGSGSGFPSGSGSGSRVRSNHASVDDGDGGEYLTGDGSSSSSDDEGSSDFSHSDSEFDSWSGEEEEEEEANPRLMNRGTGTPKEARQHYIDPKTARQAKQDAAYKVSPRRGTRTQGELFEDEQVIYMTKVYYGFVLGFSTRLHRAVAVMFHPAAGNPVAALPAVGGNASGATLWYCLGACVFGVVRAVPRVRSTLFTRREPVVVRVHIVISGCNWIAVKSRV